MQSPNAFRYAASRAEKPALYSQQSELLVRVVEEVMCCGVWWCGAGCWRYYEHREKKPSTLSKSDIQNKADILYARCCKVFKNGYQIQELIVMSVREPTADGNSMLRVENVRGRRVVDDDSVF